MESGVTESRLGVAVPTAQPPACMPHVCPHTPLPASGEQPPVDTHPPPPGLRARDTCPGSQVRPHFSPEPRAKGQVPLCWRWSQVGAEPGQEAVHLLGCPGLCPHQRPQWTGSPGACAFAPVSAVAFSKSLSVSGPPGPVCSALGQGLRSSAAQPWPQGTRRPARGCVLERENVLALQGRAWAASLGAFPGETPAAVCLPATCPELPQPGHPGRT